MCFLLLLETSTKVCSVAVSKKDRVVKAIEENSFAFSHSSKLTVFIQKVVEESGISMQKIDAVAVSHGPGSYTGLRIGTSVAKGLCYALDIPLISVDTLKAMSAVMLESKGGFIKKDDNILLCPMIDARRMEVYNAVFDYNLKQIKPVGADIINSNTFEELLKKNIIYFFGDGSAKCKKVINASNAFFYDDVLPSAKGMPALAFNKFYKQQFEDTAYFEPFYLKDFIAGKPKVKGLYN